MLSRSPPCYLGELPVDVEWTGAKGGKQWASYETWRLEVEPLPERGWRWRLERDAAGPTGDCVRGIVEYDEAADTEAEAKRRAAEALAFELLG